MQIVNMTLMAQFNVALKNRKESKSNFGLTEDEFNEVLNQLKAGNEDLFLKIFVTHFQECRFYLIDKFGVTKEKSYDICMDTLVEFRSKLLSNKIKFGNLRFLFTRMAVNNFLDETKKAQKVNEAIEVFMDQKGADVSETHEYFDLLKKAINSLSDDQKSLVEALFYSQKDLKEIAEEQNVSYANIRKMKQRVLTKLRTRFFDLIEELN